VEQVLSVNSFEKITLGNGNRPGVLDAISGLDIQFGGTVQGNGIVHGPIVNQGTIAGPDPTTDEQLVLDGDVSGEGGYSGNVVITRTFQPGNSPAEILFDGNLQFVDTTLLEIEVFPTATGIEHDKLMISGEFSAAGDLQIAGDNLSLSLDGDSGALKLLDRLTIIQADAIVGQFDTEEINVSVSSNGDLYLDVLQTEDTIEVVVMPTTWRNPLLQYDVDFDGLIAALDVLLVINALNERGPRELGIPTAQNNVSPVFFYDASGDGWITPEDALRIINAANLSEQPSDAEGEFSAASFELPVPQAVNVAIVNASPSSPVPDAGTDSNRSEYQRFAADEAFRAGQLLDSPESEQGNLPAAVNRRVLPDLNDLIAEREEDDVWYSATVDSALLELLDEFD
jgi:hypothetical protein